MGQGAALRSAVLRSRAGGGELPPGHVLHVAGDGTRFAVPTPAHRAAQQAEAERAQKSAQVDELAALLQQSRGLTPPQARAIAYAEVHDVEPGEWKPITRGEAQAWEREQAGIKAGTELRLIGARGEQERRTATHRDGLDDVDDARSTTRRAAEGRAAYLATEEGATAATVWAQLRQMYPQANPDELAGVAAEAVRRERGSQGRGSGSRTGGRAAGAAAAVRDQTTEAGRRDPRGGGTSSPPASPRNPAADPVAVQRAAYDRAAAVIRQRGGNPVHELGARP